MNRIKAECLYQKAKLCTRQRRRKKLLLKVCKLVLRPEAATRSGQKPRASTATAQVRVLKNLDIFDDATHEAVAITIARSISGHDMVKVLDGLALTQVFPQLVRGYNCKEF